MKAAIPEERRAHETRVASSPETVNKLTQLGLEVLIETGTVGVPDDHYGEEVIACVVAKYDVPCEEQELIDYYAGKVGGFKAPRAIYFMSDLPKGSSGKVQRRKLLALIEGGFPTSLPKES